MKRNQIKRSGMNRPMDKAAMQALERAAFARDRDCVLSGVSDEACDGDHFDAHHLIPQRVIRHLPEAPEVLADVRNVVILCRYHHNRIEQAVEYLSDDLLPEGFHAFLKEWGLEVEWEAAKARRSE